MRIETNFFDASARILRGEGVIDAIREIANEQAHQEEAFMVLNVGDVVQKIKTWKLLMPRVKPFYAVKCNDNKTVLKTLSSLGTGFDCASKAEMLKVLDMGVAPDRIIYAHPCKPSSHLRQASVLGVDLMTFDNEIELHKIKQIMPAAKLVIRIRCDAAKAQCLLGDKFGVDPEDALGLLLTAKTLGLNVAGVSFHVGSGCQEPEVFLRAITASRQVFDEAVNLGFGPYLLDIGGGFPGTTGASLDDIAHWVNLGIEQCFPEQEIEIIAEPGRYVVASAFTLVTQIISKRRVDPRPGPNAVEVDPSFMYYINDGVYGSMNCILYDHQEVVPEYLDMDPTSSAPAVSSLPLFTCSIWGPTCDSLDQVVANARLPELNIGDRVLFRDMGAYTISAAGTFNGFPVPNVHVVIPFHTWLSLEGILGKSFVAQNTVGEAPPTETGVTPIIPNHLSGPTMPIPSFASLFNTDQDHGLEQLNSNFKRFHVAEI